MPRRVEGTGIEARLLYRGVPARTGAEGNIPEELLMLGGTVLLRLPGTEGGLPWWRLPGASPDVVPSPRGRDEDENVADQEDGEEEDGDEEDDDDLEDEDFEDEDFEDEDLEDLDDEDFDDEDFDDEDFDDEDFDDEDFDEDEDEEADGEEKPEGEVGGDEP
jgi:hypothetical protein